MFNMLSGVIGAAGGAVNGALDNAVQGQNQLAQAQASATHLRATQEQMKKMDRDTDIKVLNGKVESNGMVKI